MDAKYISQKIPDVQAANIKRIRFIQIILLLNVVIKFIFFKFTDLKHKINSISSHSKLSHIFTSESYILVSILIKLLFRYEYIAILVFECLLNIKSCTEGY